MDYTKKPLSIAVQISKLQGRGLIIDDKEAAERYLSNISYYRLRAYTYPFQDNINDEADHRFTRPDINFLDVIDLYCFDRRLRSLVFNAIEKIEVAVRTKISQIYSEHTNNGHWFCEASEFRDADGRYQEGGIIPSKFGELMCSINNEVKRSNEDFIGHYRKKYGSPCTPPSWMTLEVLSMSTLSQLYENLLMSDQKKEVARCFGVNNVRFFETWLHGLSVLRNCCAHHSRTWNRRFIINLPLPKDTVFPFIPRDDIGKIHTNKMFAYLSVIKYILDIISPTSNFKGNFISIMEDGGKLLKLSDMGFITNWQYFSVWKDK